jgi:hypothetical protein
MPTYHELNERFSLERNQVIAIYLNCFFSSLSFFVLIIIAATLSPVAQDASILIKDAGESLNDFSIMIPEINGLIPEAQNTTRILGHMIPRINQGMFILRQLCLQDPECHLH